MGVECTRHLSFMPGCKYCERKREIEEGLRNLKAKNDNEEQKAGPPITGCSNYLDPVKGCCIHCDAKLKIRKTFNAYGDDSYVARQLREKADLFESRNAEYGDAYKDFGRIMEALIGGGVHIEGPDDYNRWGVFIQIVNKLRRYAANFDKGGHADSLDDIAVYAMMLKELDDDVST